MSIFSKFFKKRTTVLVNGELTVIFKSGDTVIFHEATMDDYNVIQDMNDDEVIVFYYTKLEEQRLKSLQEGKKKSVQDVIQIKEAEKQVKLEKKEDTVREIALVKEVRDNFPLLTKTGDFAEHSGAVYLIVDGKELPLSIPATLLKRFVYLAQKIEANNSDALDEYVALKNFWMWLSLNPVAENREKLYDFVTRNGLKINSHGLFFAYRMILATNKGNSMMSKELVTMISDFYLKIKKAKKGPNSFNLVKDSEGDYGYRHIDKGVDDVTVIGNVGTLYFSLADAQEQMFTDNYTRTFDIRIGREVSQDASKCDFDSNVSFSRGLHNGSVNYGLFNGFGDTPVLTLINPMKVCAVPAADVLRSTAYLPVAIITEKTSADVLRSGDTLSIADEYYIDSVKELKQLLKDHTPQELHEQNILADLSNDTITLIANSVENIEETLKERVITA